VSHLPTPALPDQVRTVGGAGPAASHPLSPVSPSSRVVVAQCYPPEAASTAGACSTTWCSTKGWPTSGELLAKVCQARQEPDQRSRARAPTRGRNRMAIRCGTGGHAEPPGLAPERRVFARRKVGLRVSAVLRSPLRPMIRPTRLHKHPSPRCADTSGHAAIRAQDRRRVVTRCSRQ